MAGVCDGEFLEPSSWDELVNLTRFYCCRKPQEVKVLSGEDK